MGPPLSRGLRGRCGIRAERSGCSATSTPPSASKNKEKMMTGTRSRTDHRSDRQSILDELRKWRESNDEPESSNGGRRSGSTRRVFGRRPSKSRDRHEGLIQTGEHDDRPGACRGRVELTRLYSRSPQWAP